MTFRVLMVPVLVDHLTCKRWFHLLAPQMQRLVVNQVLKKGGKKAATRKTALRVFDDCGLQVKKDVFFLPFLFSHHS